MRQENFNFTAGDRENIFVYRWAPEDKSNTKVALQIAHGMAEHAGRYKNFAEFLTSRGFIVYANDHRGHGKTAGSIENVGYIADDHGWDIVVNDTHELTNIIKKENPGLPVFILGHSFGSLILRDYISSFGNDIEGAIMSGTSADPGLLGVIGKILAKRETKKKGKRAKSPLLDNLCFGKFNKAFKPNRTDFDWLSKDIENVDNYIKDPYCGDVFSAVFYYDLIVGVKKISSFDSIDKIPKDLPIFLLAGQYDPVGNNTKDVSKVYRVFKKADIKDVNYKFYSGARHEILNDFCKNTVYKDILEWINNHV